VDIDELYRTLVQMFPACGLGVAVAADSVVYESDVFSASHGPDEARSPRRHRTKQWGGNAVLVLIGLRLGLDGVNPIYYDTIKVHISYQRL
jgi:cysteine protease ATG4